MALAAVYRSACLLGCLLALAACSGSTDTNESDGSLLRLAGSVGDGPVVGATIHVYDADGALLDEVVSDDAATYRLTLPGDVALPVSVVASGGTDLVTGRELDFPLHAAATRSGALTVNLSPLSTVAVRAAQCLGGITDDHLAEAWARIHDQLDLGLDATVMADPMFDPVTADNVEAVVLANEALGETVRRTEAALAASAAPRSGDALLEEVACALLGADATPDGRAIDHRVVGAFKSAELAVRLETLAGRLEVDGQPATARLDESIRTIMPELASPSVADVPVSASARRQTVALLAVFAPSIGDAALTRLTADLEHAALPDVPALVDDVLNAGLHNALLSLAEQTALADEMSVAALNDRLARQADAAPPLLSLAAEPPTVTAGAAAQLSWASVGAEACHADGAWSGSRPAEGWYGTGPVYVASTYRLTCTGLGGSVEREVRVGIASADAPEPDPEPAPAPEPEPEPAPEPQPAPAPEPEPEPEPTPAPEPEPAPTPEPEPEPAPQPSVQLAADQAVVASGASTRLAWTSTDASSCSASGGWSGARATGGSEWVGPIHAQTTYSLSCSGAGGSAVAMISVAVNGTVTLNWQAPTQNVDGTPLTDLAGYRIHYGTTSRSYTQSVAVGTSGATSHALQLPSGTYYFAMTALDAQGNESAYSNEVIKSVD